MIQRLQHLLSWMCAKRHAHAFANENVHYHHHQLHHMDCSSLVLHPLRAAYVRICVVQRTYAAFVCLRPCQRDSLVCTTCSHRAPGSCIPPGLFAGAKARTLAACKLAMRCTVLLLSLKPLLTCRRIERCNIRWFGHPLKKNI